MYTEMWSRTLKHCSPNAHSIIAYNTVHFEAYFISAKNKQIKKANIIHDYNTVLEDS